MLMSLTLNSFRNNMKVLYQSWVLIILLLVPLPGMAQVSPKPNPYETKIIRNDILTSFRNLMNMPPHSKILHSGSLMQKCLMRRSTNCSQ